MARFPYFASIFDYISGRYFTKAANLNITSRERTTDQDIERIDISFIEKTRKAIRWIAANNTDINSIINAKVGGTIGLSVNIQSRIQDMPELNTEIEDLIQQWSEAEHCEVTGRWHFDGLLRAMVEFTEKDGGFLIRHHYNPSWELKYRVEIIEVGMIDTSKHNEKTNLLNGIQRDNYGRVSGIYLYENQERLNSKIVSSDELIYYSPVWVSISQYTALSKLSAILPTIDKLDEYSDAELQAATERAKAGAYWKTSLYDDLMKVLKDIKDSSVKELKLNEVMEKIKGQGIKPSGLSPIPLGDEIVTQGSQSDTIYDSLTSNAQLKMASSAGTSSQIAYQDSSKSNYSAIKAVMALTEINWGIEFDNLRAKVIHPIMKKVITTGHAYGRLSIDDFYANRRKYFKLEYMRVATIDIEPLKTANANRTNIENGIMSQREIAKKRGRNIEDVQREIIEDEINLEKMRRKMYKQAGIEIQEQDNGTDD